MDSQLTAALIGGAIALIAALGTQLVGARLRREDRRASDRASRIAAYLTATHGVVISLGRIAREPMSQKRELAEDRSYAIREDAVNEQLNSIKLLDSETVVLPVMELDQCLIQLRQDALRKEWEPPDWAARRTEILRDVVERVVNSARAVAGESSINLVALADTAHRAVPREQPGVAP